MKLKLSQQGDVSVLDVLEEVSLQNVSVLRAGISKILQSGKSKIALNLTEVVQLKVDVLQEIIKLDAVAAGLNGSLVFIGQSELISQALKAFAAPPTIKHFSSLAEALAPPTAAQATPASPPAALPSVDPSDPHAELKTKIIQLEAEGKALQAKLQSRANPDELRKLRFENGIFQLQLTAMEEQYQMIIKEKKKPFEMESHATKISQLESAMSEFLEKEGLVGKK